MAHDIIINQRSPAAPFTESSLERAKGTIANLRETQDLESPLVKEVLTVMEALIKDVEK